LFAKYVIVGDGIREHMLGALTRVLKNPRYLGPTPWRDAVGAAYMPPSCGPFIRVHLRDLWAFVGWVGGLHFSLSQLLA
jgi:hypothetical protein